MRLAHLAPLALLAPALGACAPDPVTEGYVLALESDFALPPTARLSYSLVTLDDGTPVPQSGDLDLEATCSALGGARPAWDGTPCVPGRRYRIWPGTLGIGPSGSGPSARRGAFVVVRLVLRDATNPPLAWKAITVQLPEGDARVLRVPFSALDVGSAVTATTQSVRVGSAASVCPDTPDALTLALDGATGSVGGECRAAIVNNATASELPVATADATRVSGACFSTTSCSAGARVVTLSSTAEGCVGTAEGAPLRDGEFNVFYNLGFGTFTAPDGASDLPLRRLRATDGPLGHGWSLRANGTLLLPRALCAGIAPISTRAVPAVVRVSTACPTRPAELPLCPGAAAL